MYSLRSRKSHPVYAAWSQSLSGNSSLLQQCHDISISMNLPRCTVWLKTGKAIVGSLLWQYSILDFSKSSIRMTSHKTFFVSGAVAGCQFEVVRKGWLWIIPVLNPMPRNIRVHSYLAVKLLIKWHFIKDHQCQTIAGICKHEKTKSYSNLLLEGLCIKLYSWDWKSS